MNNLLAASLRNRILASLLAGAMLLLVLNLTPWWPLAWLAPVPLLLAAFHSPTWREASLLAILAAAIGLASNLPYYSTTGGNPAVAVVILLLQALVWSAAILYTRGIVRRFGSDSWLVVFAYPLFWAALDTVIAAISPHASAGSLAYTQMDFLPVIQIAMFTGTPGIVFVISLFASTVALLIFRGPRIPVVAYALPALVTAAVLAFGFIRLAGEPASRHIRVGLAVVDSYVGERTPAARRAQVWTGYETAVAQMASKGAQLILLPEKIETFTDAKAAGERQERMAAVARANHVYLAAGIGEPKNSVLLNRFWLFSPSGDLTATYDKHHLVPGLEAEFTPSKDFVTSSIDNARYGLAICKDMHFANLGRNYGKLGVDAMLVPAWDFDRDAWMMARLTALRGVESGFPIIRSSRQGILSVTDPLGRVVAETRSSGPLRNSRTTGSASTVPGPLADRNADPCSLPGATLLVDAPIGRAASITPYARFGDVFGWLCVALAAFVRLIR